MYLTWGGGRGKYVTCHGLIEWGLDLSVSHGVRLPVAGVVPVGCVKAIELCHCQTPTHGSK